jgi:hypothetical protein
MIAKDFVPIPGSKSFAIMKTQLRAGLEEVAGVALEGAVVADGHAGAVALGAGAA